MNEQPPVLTNFELSVPQQQAALVRDRDVAVTAGAGTGKTRTLVARYLALLDDGLPLRQIVAVTFTRKAAREMRNRVRGEIGRYLRRPGLSTAEIERWSTIYNELDAARINTIHNLCAEILRAHPAEAGTDPRFTILDETQAPLLVLEAVETALAWAVEAEGLDPLFNLLRESQLLELITVLINQRWTAQEIFAALPADQILAHWAALLDRYQAQALEQLLSDPEFYTARQVIEENQAGKAHDLCEIQRQVALHALQGLDAETIPDRLDRLSALAAIKLNGGSQVNWPGGRDQLKAVKDALRVLRDAYGDVKILHYRLNAQDEAIAAAMPAIQRLFNTACAAYQALKTDREGLDFDDLEALAIRLLEAHAPVRDYWQSQTGALLVDEFQDTNEQQRQFMRLLCPDPGKLFIVGDAKQSIYRFRGADVTVFAHEKEAISSQGGALIDLDTSYRAHEPLLEGMNRLLGPILGDPGPDQPPWVAPFAPLKPGIETAVHDQPPPYIEVHLAIGNKPDALPRAANALAGRLVQLHEQYDLDYGAMAILCRASNAFQYYENAFDDAGIPYLTVAGKGFYDRPEIRDLLNALTAIVDPHDDLALTGLLRSPACGLSDPALYRLSRARSGSRSLWDTVQEESVLPDTQENERLRTAVALIHALNQQAGRVPVADILKRFLDETHYRAGLRRAGRPRALRNVAKLLQDVHNSELVSIDAFLEYQTTLRDSGSREGEARTTAGGAVQIMSIHAAKGLEFPLVVLGDAASEPGQGGGGRIAVDPELGILLPYKNEEQQQAASYQLAAEIARQQDAAEADRLLYVALTRAQQMLLISGHFSQTSNGRASWKGWLKQLVEVCAMADLDLSAYDEQGDGSHTYDYLLQETAVHTAVYEPNFTPPLSVVTAVEARIALDQLASSPLQEPIVAGDPAAEEIEEAPLRRLWQVIPARKSSRAPAWLIGSLVHQALAAWRFPGPGFEQWVRARARGHGLADPQRLRHAQVEVARLLNRFQEHELYRQIENASRRYHELPYSCPENGNGRIDLLFQDDSGWTVVDFKTDRVRDDVTLKTLRAERGYDDQLQQYGQAVQHLLEVTPQLKLCFLNHNHIKVVEIVGYRA